MSLPGLSAARVDTLGLLLAVHIVAAWITARRRLATDHEGKPAHAETVIRWAMTHLIVRRLTEADLPPVPIPNPHDKFSEPISNAL